VEPSLPGRRLRRVTQRRLSKKLRPSRFSRKLFWISGELVLVFLLWVNVLAADRPRAHLIGTTISSPTNGSIVSTIREISGETLCPAGLSGAVQIRLRHVATGKFWDWAEDRWNDNGALEFIPAEGTQTPWRILLPQLAEGRYELQCSSIDSGVRRSSRNSRFLVDRTAPSVSFFPLHDQETIDDVFEIGGEIDEPAEIQFTIWRVSARGQRLTCWNGKTWDANVAKSELRASSAHGYWFPAAETTLPKADEIQSGTYLISATAVDGAGNEGRAAVTVHKASLRQFAKD
jgi:hypothetical protein